MKGVAVEWMKEWFDSGGSGVVGRNVVAWRDGYIRMGGVDVMNGRS